MRLIQALTRRAERLIGAHLLPNRDSERLRRRAQIRRRDLLFRLALSLLSNLLHRLENEINNLPIGIRIIRVLLLNLLERLVQNRHEHTHQPHEHNQHEQHEISRAQQIIRVL